MSPRSFAPLLALTAIAGCRSAPATPTTEGAEPLPFESFCASLVDVVSRRQAECTSGPVSAWKTRLAADSGCDEIEAGILAGAIRYRPEAAERCLERLRAEPCGPGLELGVGLCADALAGLAGLDEPCFSDFECAPGSTCRMAMRPDHSRACPGVCVASQPIGATCDGQRLCVPGTTCVEGICVAPGSEGEACGPRKPRCGSGLECVKQSNGSICLPLATAVECTSSSDCGFDELCEPRDGRGLCAPKRLPGASCAPGKRECGRLSYCGDDGICVEWSTVGGPCGAFNGESAGCLDGYCDSRPGERGVCRAFRAAGEKCEPGPASGCRQGCERESGTCEQKCALRPRQ